MFKPPVKRPGGGGGVTKPRQQNDKKAKKKLVVACMGCRKKKIRCSGDRPCCTNCLRLNGECVYPLIKNRGSRYEYKDMIKRRMDNLEKYYDSSLTTTIIQQQHPPTVKRGTDDPQANTVESLMSQIKPRQDSNPDSSAYHQNGTPAVNLPPMELVEHLTDLYFKHVHGQTYAFLHRPSFMTRLRNGQVNDALILAICGLSARYSRNPNVATNETYTAGDSYTATAKQLILKQAFEGQPSLETVQALICVIQNDFFRSRGGKTMIFVSIATRLAADLMLHLNKFPQDSTWVDQECQRRTFWSLMVLDRLAHSSPMWTVQFSDENFAGLPLPCTEQYYNDSVANIKTPCLNELGQDPEIDKNIGLFAYHIQAVMLWCDVNKYAMGHDLEKPWSEKSNFMTLRHRVEQFKNTLPSNLLYSKARLSELHSTVGSGQYIHLHTEILLSECVLNRSICHHHNDKMPPQEFIDSATSAAISAADSLSSIVFDILHTGDSVTVAPFIGFAVFTVSAVHVTNSFSSNAVLADRSKQHLATNLKLLVDLRQFWYAVGVWCNILKDRYAKRSSRLQQQDSTEEQDPSSPPPPYLPEEFMHNNPATGHGVVEAPPQHHLQQQQQQQQHHQVLKQEEEQQQPHQAPVTSESAWDEVIQSRRGEQELIKEWGNMASGIASPSQFADMFLGFEDTRGLVDQFSTEWFSDLQSLME